MKPLFKWLIGPVATAGWESLGVAIENARWLYGDSVDYAVCFNGVTQDEVYRHLPLLNSLRVELFDQAAFRRSGATKFGWKFFPLKIDDARREMWMDNDVVLYERQPDIEAFLFGGDEVLLVAQDAMRWYKPQVLDAFLPAGQGCSGGLFGIPAWPIAQMRKAFEAFVDSHKIPRDLTHFTCDSLEGTGRENATIGLLAMLFSSQCRWIPHSCIPVGSAICRGAVGTCGMHFTGLNHPERPEVESFFRNLAMCPSMPRKGETSNRQLLHGRQL